MVKCISIEFPGHVSKSDLSSLVVELIEYILFMRGQFPFRFDEGKKYVNELQRRHENTKETFETCGDSPYRNHECIGIARDNGNQNFKKISSRLKKAEQQLVQSVRNFDSYLKKLSSLLCKHEVRELVLNFGKNFLMPKELFYIKLPARCLCSDSETALPFQKCKRYLFRKLFENQLNGRDLPSEDLFPVSVMLRTLDVDITDDMEQKPFYSVPLKRRLYEIELNFRCKHLCRDLTKPVENGDDITENTCKLTLNEEMSPDLQSDLWVQLMPVLKGFRDNFTPEYSLEL